MNSRGRYLTGVMYVYVGRVDDAISFLRLSGFLFIMKSPGHSQTCYPKRNVMVVNSREKLNSTQRVPPTSIIIALLSPVTSSVAAMMSIEEVIKACKLNKLTEKEQRELIYSYLYNLIR